MKKIIILLIVCCLKGNAQNLVVNPSFEQHTQCPTAMSQISYCNSWFDGVTHGSCDYYSANVCAGNFSPPLLKPVIFATWYQQPLSGKSFAGFIPYYGEPGAPSTFAEFLQGKFSSALDSNKLYYIEYYINSAPNMKYFLHDIEALLTDTMDPNNLQNYSPQILPMAGVIYSDTIRWMRINGYYTANGREKYITIGNYTPYGHELKDSVGNYTSQTAYYFIDSVGVYPVTQWDSWNAGPDKYITLGDSAQIGNPSTDYSMFSWVTSTGGITYLSDSTMPQIWSKPPATTTYYVTKTQGTKVFQDTVTVYVNTIGISQISGLNAQITVYPNPANTSFTLNLSKGEGTYNITLYDMLGNIIMQHLYSTPSEGQGEAIDVSGLNEGIYNLSIATKAGVLNKRVIILR